jgi:hypothetical protein
VRQIVVCNAGRFENYSVAAIQTSARPGRKGKEKGNMNKDKLEQLCFLTDKQRKTFKLLKSAYKKCLDEKIYFHQVLETLSAYNGINVDGIDDNSF